MDLKRYLPGNDADKNLEYYWALILEPNFVQACIWRISGSSAQIVYTSNPIAWETEEDLVSSTDNALSAAIHDFPEDLREPNKTVFGVVSSWVSEGEIKEDYLERIQKLCKELSLKPAGFVVLSEAIAHYLKVEEGSPLNSILIGVYEDKLEVALFKLGNLAGSTHVARSVSLVEDVVEGLSRFGDSGAFPSRFILYDGREKQLDEAQQQLIKASWEEYDSIKFLHPPKTEKIAADNKLDAVSLAGAAEMAEVDKVERVKLVGGVSKQTEELAEPELPEEVSKTQEQPEGIKDTASPEELGFTVGDEADIVGDPIPVEQEDEIQYSQDAPRINYPQSQEDVENFVSVDESEMTKPPQEADEQPERQGIKIPSIGIGGIVSKISSPFKSIGGFLSIDSQLKKIFTFGIISLLIIFSVGLALWWYYPTATVTIYLSPQQQNERVDIFIDPDADEVNIETRTLPGHTVSTTVSDERTISTTGTKLVGEQATGEVKLFRVGTQISLEAGTLLRGPNNLRFSLDDNVEVASGSAGTPGTTTAKVTAQDIGAEYNLASGSTFTVGNYSDSDIEAKNESDFSGGTSREINAVSERDLVNLEDELTEELQQRALEQLNEDLSQDQILINDSLEQTTEERDFSADEGDEAETLKLNMTMSVQVYAVNESELITLAKDILKNKVPQGYVLRDENIDVDFDLDEETEGIFKYDTRVTANLLPQADPDEIKQNIRGKYHAFALEYLDKNIPGFVRAEFVVNPKLPGKLNSLPRQTDNIEIEISAEK